MKLRDYQQKAVEAVFGEWQDAASTAVVCPTGTGKTQIFCECIRRTAPGRSIVLVHRDELVWQAVRRIESFGLEASVEKADLRASTSFWNRTPVVVATVQTLISGNGSRRLERFDPSDFSLLICDEMHHAVSTSWRLCIDHFRRNPNLRVLGVTATPDRADEEALGQVFDTVAFDYEILDAIHDGWLVPVTQRMVHIEDLDFSRVRTTAGDLNGADLARVMEAEQNMQGVAGATLDIVGDRKTLVFTASVRHAEMLSDIFNRHRPGMAGWICGFTPEDERRQLLKRYSADEFQIICNCAVLGEGWDEPTVEVVVSARPTKSRSLYAQQLGRAMRPLAGVVDGLPNAEARKAAIAASAKPEMEVVDFVGNAGRHKLMSAADVLGGKVSEEAVALAIRKAQQAGRSVNVANLLDVSEEEIQRQREEAEKRRLAEAARKARLVAQVQYTTRYINPFDAFALTPIRERGWDKGKILSEKQANLLRKQGIDPSKLTYSEGRQIISEFFRRWNNNLASLKQCALLKKRGHDTTNLSRDEASKLITAIASKEGWRQRN